jgi:cell division protein ZapE
MQHRSHHNSPSVVYQAWVAEQRIQADSKQQILLTCLDDFYYRYCQHKQPSRIKRLLGYNASAIQGLYLWGGVGIGKTLLMDLLFDCLPGKRKRRYHFHQFMHMLHQQLHRLQGKANPLEKIVRRLACQFDVIFFDEFFVKDIGDAMLLAGLLRTLFRHGISLVATSNTQPGELYLNGIQREQFLPAIDLIERHTQLVHASAQQDYRLRELEDAGVFFTPITAQTTQHLRAEFTILANGDIIENGSLDINGRSIPTVMQAEDVVWFEFAVICHAPRSHSDYLALAQYYHTVFVSNVTPIKPEELNKLRYLIHLVDVFYDNKVNLILSSQVAIEEIYPTGQLAQDFQRTQSRLREMQSVEYLKQQHLFNQR